MGDLPYKKQRVYSALRSILTALVEEHSVNLFIFEDAVFLTKKRQKPPEMLSLLEHEAIPDCEELLKAAFNQWGPVKVCMVCNRKNW